MMVLRQEGQITSLNGWKYKTKKFREYQAVQLKERVAISKNINCSDTAVDNCRIYILFYTCIFFVLSNPQETSLFTLY